MFDTCPFTSADCNSTGCMFFNKGEDGAICNILQLCRDIHLLVSKQTTLQSASEDNLKDIIEIADLFNIELINLYLEYGWVILLKNSDGRFILGKTKNSRELPPSPYVDELI